MFPSSWKAFHMVCIYQALIAALHGVYSFILLISTSGFIYYGLQILAFICIMLFANLGSSILHYNYPNTPVADRRKKQFNTLYLLNFFLPSFLAAHFYIQFKEIVFLFAFNWDTKNLLLLMLPSLFYLIMLIMQIILVVGMFRLRREIYQRFYREINKIASEEV